MTGKARFGADLDFPQDARHDDFDALLAPNGADSTQSLGSPAGNEKMQNGAQYVPHLVRNSGGFVFSCHAGYCCILRHRCIPRAAKESRQATISSDQNACTGGSVLELHRQVASLKPPIGSLRSNLSPGGADILVPAWATKHAIHPPQL